VYTLTYIKLLIINT